MLKQNQKYNHSVITKVHFAAILKESTCGHQTVIFLSFCTLLTKSDELLKVAVHPGEQRRELSAWVSVTDGVCVKCRVCTQGAPAAREWSSDQTARLCSFTVNTAKLQSHSVTREIKHQAMSKLPVCQHRAALTHTVLPCTERTGNVLQGDKH